MTRHLANRGGAGAASPVGLGVPPSGVLNLGTSSRARVGSLSRSVKRDSAKLYSEKNSMGVLPNRAWSLSRDPWMGS